MLQPFIEIFVQKKNKKLNNQPIKFTKFFTFLEFFFKCKLFLIYILLKILLTSIKTSIKIILFPF